jgi:hypothetical protein
MQCDERKPVCRKCEVHFANIDECDYGQHDVLDVNRAESTEEASEEPRPATWEEQLTLQPKRGRPSIGPRRSVSPTLLDPFKSHPDCSEPEADLLMKMCK